MSSDVVIRVENLSKRYTIRHNGSSSGDGLRHILHDAATKPIRALKARFVNRRSSANDGGSSIQPAGPGLNTRRQNGGPAEEDFYALRDVSLDVRRGEVLGIIGRNGAGKSTLLKILSRITEPTTGRIGIKGRVASLLEVGTGFHQELTGRENIFLNGAILGMSRSEIKAKFDEIVAFSEVERFLDTPVKRYSSGMYVRLAFAVAAHLEPEILIVDEVLAVGDAQFQKKCLGKINDVATREGRTVIFVSHNMGVISTLCSRAVLLNGGKSGFAGDPAQAIERYMSISDKLDGTKVWEDNSRPRSDRVGILAVRVTGDGRTSGTVSLDRPIELSVDFETYLPDLELSTSFHIIHSTAGEILSSANFPSASIGRDPWFGKAFPKGRFRAACTIPANFFNEGTFTLNVVILRSVQEIEVIAREVLRFTTQDTGGMREEYTGNWIGVVRPRLPWKTEAI